MARLTLSPNGLKSPLDVPVADAARVAAVEPAPTEPAPAEPAAPKAFVVPDPAEFPVIPDLDAPAPADATAAEAPAPVAGVPDATPAGDLPAWATSLDAAALQPDRLLGRPKQTALILDRELSSRADELVAATGPRVTFAALVIAVLHFHLPTDGAAAAKAIGGYRRRKLESLDHPWEERNARLPEPLRAELDDVVSGAVGRVAAVRRSTLVNALLDAHLPASPDDAARLVTRMEMVRGGAFLA
jgi:hypothetical protein